MKIVIGGAGDVGFHLASLMVTENQDIVLIDNSNEVLAHAAAHIDVSTVYGEVTSLKSLGIANTEKADLFIAVTTSESTNLLACILAKKMGAKKTVARIQNPEFFQEEQRKNFKESGVDNLFSPGLLAVKEINRLIGKVSATDIYEFEEGKISIIGFTADEESNFIGKSIKNFSDDATNHHIRVLTMMRNNKTLVPHEDLIIERGDHIYISTDISDFKKINKYVGKVGKRVKNIMIIGQDLFAIRTAMLLEKQYRVKLILSEDKECKIASDLLSEETLIIKGDTANIDLLKENGLKNMDALVALVKNSETNIINCLIAEKQGAIKTIALVDNTVYTQISQNIGVDTIINKKLLAANNIFRYLRKGNIEAIASFHGINAEIIEFIVSTKTKVIGKMIKEVGLPKRSRVAGIIRNNKGMIPKGDMKFRNGDKVIIFLEPLCVSQVENIFNETND